MDQAIPWERWPMAAVRTNHWMRPGTGQTTQALWTETGFTGLRTSKTIRRSPIRTETRSHQMLHQDGPTAWAEPCRDKPCTRVGISSFSFLEFPSVPRLSVLTEPLPHGNGIFLDRLVRQPSSSAILITTFRPILATRIISKAA